MGIIDETIEKMLESGGEHFILARDAKQAESLRVMAFNCKRKMPASLTSNIGLQKVQEDGKWFLRVFDRKLDEAQVWERDKETGRLIPAKNTDNPELLRMKDLMRKDGLSEQEIEAALKVQEGGKENG